MSWFVRNESANVPLEIEANESQDNKYHYVSGGPPMKTGITLAALLTAMILIPASLFGQNKFIGVKACTMCHKTDKQGKQLAIWEASDHAKAYKTLLTDKANVIAKEKGIAKPAAEAAECLACHTPNHDKPELFDKGYDMKDGVQCESCHGAGSGYKTLTIMKDKAKAVAAGMKEYKNMDEIKAHCVTCHNDKSPTFKEFKFEEMLEKIKHPIPKN